MSAHAYTAAEVEHIAKRLGGAGRNGSRWDCRCPAHEDRNPSLSLSLGDDGELLWHCHAGCEQSAVLKGLKQANVLMNGDARKAEPKRNARKKVVAVYSYTNESGQVLYEKVRYEPKGFVQRLPDGTYKLGDTRRVLYRLDEVIAAAEVLFVEGEKDADRLRSLGFTVTTNVEGASKDTQKPKWREEYSAALAGKNLIFIPDNDAAGQAHMENAARSCHAAGAASIRLIQLEGLPEKGDASDWLDAGHSANELRELIAKAPEFQDQEPHGVEDDGLALELGREWKNEARHVAKWGKWLFWDGSKWEQDDKLLHMTLTREFLRRKEIGDAPRVARVASLARSNRNQAATDKQWDLDPWLLGTPGGTVDLRTGQLRTAQRGDYITRLAAVAPAPKGTPTPLWTAFLNRTFGGDQEMIAFVQRVAGYALTGSVEEHALFFLWGQGANGKGVFLNTLTRLLDGYASVAPVDMFLVTQSDRHPTDMAMLRAARLVTAQETPPGRTWDEAKIKALTGGDPVTARYMRQDFFTYDPQFTLIIAGNTKPSLRGVGEAIRRRFNLIPFNVIIPAAERDKGLADKLKAEWPGILRWALEGCLAWQREGLKPPAGVVAATDDYLAGEDIIGQWIGDCCEEGHALRQEQDKLYASWCEWSERNRGPRHSSRAFYRLLTERGFEQKPADGKRWMLGLRLTPSVTEVTELPLSTVYAHARAHTHVTSHKGGSVTSVTRPEASGSNACAYCGEHCSPTDMGNSVPRADGGWHHLDCFLAQP